MNGWRDEILKLIGALIFLVLVVGGFAMLSDTQDKNVESKLTAKQSELWKAIRHERKKEVISLLQSAGNIDEIHELADAVSVDGSEVSYSAVVDGQKETIMFYHSQKTWGFSPVAGIVLQR